VVEIHVRAKHPNIVEFIGHGHAASSGCPATTPFLVLHRMQSALHAYETNVRRGLLPPHDLRLVYLSLRDAFNYLHRHMRVLHLDVHTNNVLVEYNQQGLTKVCLSDFGRARQFSTDWVKGPAISVSATLPKLVTYPSEIYDIERVGPHSDLLSYTMMGLQLFLGQQQFKSFIREHPTGRGNRNTYLTEVGSRIQPHGPPGEKRKISWNKKKWLAPITVITHSLADAEEIRNKESIDKACAALLVFVNAL
jgi:serine/threonine protein kinase